MSRNKFARILVGETYRLDGKKRVWVCASISGGTDPLAIFTSKGEHELRLPVRRARKRMEVCRDYS